MRLIGSLPSESEARSFVSWLLTKSIECHVEQDGDKDFDIWVKDEDGFETAKSELIEFRANPKNEKYRKAVAEAQKIEDQKVARQKKIQQNMQGSGKPRGIFETAPLTMVMVMICAVVALLTGFGSAEYDQRAVARALKFVAVDSPSDELKQAWMTNPDSMEVRLASIYRGELWRTISPIFYHHGTFHLVFNMLWLVQLGRMIETRYGTLRLAMIVVFSAIVSNVIQCVVPFQLGGAAPILQNNLLINHLGGMSGVVYALFGFIWFRMLYDPESRFFLPQSTVIILIGWLFFCMLSPQLGGVMGDGRVANWAHGAGMVMGLLLGWTPIGKRKSKK